ncbi:MAG: hypothetical protein Q8L21_01195 [Candidatus Komeilibacteria bacterium]|nr:hypothetical protein [Candidatus Komeilibacteria bacterium]
MLNQKNNILRLILISVCFLGLAVPRIAWGAELEEEIKNIYNTYSQYLDKQWVSLGWEYSVPSYQYQEINKHSLDNLRLQATLATAYRFRTDDESVYKISTAITNVLGKDMPLVNSVPQNGQMVSTRGFGDMIGLYLALQLLVSRPDIFSAEEQTGIIEQIKKIYPWALRANDTENRALISAAYGLAIMRHPLLALSAEEKTIYKKQIIDKIKIGREAIDKLGIYREGQYKKYSLHYHLVAALMLSYLGENLPNKQYAALSKSMLSYIHKRYALDKLDWRGSERPTGIGLQTVLLRTWGEKYLGNKNWKNYWDVEKKKRGFIDPSNPKRLIWKDDIDGTLNDDYSFINMAELFWP